MAKLIAQMVARNEANRFLPEVLEHLNKVADLVVFTDDCSTDNTLEVAKSYGCETFASQWDHAHFEVNEGELRGAAWQNLTQFAEPGDWILGIDADEKFYGVDLLPELMNQDEYPVLGICHYHMWNRTQFRIDKAWRPSLSVRLFRYLEGGTYESRQLAGGSEPDYVKMLVQRHQVNWYTGLKMMHLGYLRDEDKQHKYDRYMRLDGGRFHSLPHLESIIDPNPVLDNWED